MSSFDDVENRLKRTPRGGKVPQRSRPSSPDKKGLQVGTSTSKVGTIFLLSVEEYGDHSDGSVPHLLCHSHGSCSHLLPRDVEPRYDLKCTYPSLQ
jgi:hypothetical protein